MAVDLSNYVDVPQRIKEFREKYPEGSLQAADPANPFQIVQIPCRWCRRCKGSRQVQNRAGDYINCSRCGGSGLRDEEEPNIDVFIVYTAAAYRTPDDPRPGIGIAWEPVPGKTPYTADSEMMNAETSAWGRAIIAVGAADSSKIASREEVRNRTSESGPLGQLIQLLSGSGWTKAEQKHILEIGLGHTVPNQLERLSEDELAAAVDFVSRTLEEK